MDFNGDIPMWVVPSRQAVQSLSETSPAQLHCTRSAAMAALQVDVAQVVTATWRRRQTSSAQPAASIASVVGSGTAVEIGSA